MKSSTSISVSILLIGALLSSSFSFVFIPTLDKKAEAAIVNCAPSNTLVGTQTTASQAEATQKDLTGVPVAVGHTIFANLAVISATSFSQNFKVSCLDGIGWMLAKIIVAYLTQSVLQWINTGFQGSPTFVTDPQGFLGKVADNQFVAVMNYYFPDSGAASIVCSPFSDQIKEQIARRLGGLHTNNPGGFQYNNRYETPSACNLFDDASGRSVDDQFNNFVSGDFSDGGWDRWFNVTQNTSNNPDGALFQTQKAAENNINSEVQNQQNILNWGDGFHSITKDSTNANTSSQIVTPGKQIQEMLQKTLSSGVDELNAADSIDEIVSVLVGQLLTKVASGGVSGLSQSDSDPSNGGKSYLELIGQEANQASTTAANDRSSSAGYTIPDVDITVAGNTGGTPENLITSSSVATQSSNYNSNSVAANAIDGQVAATSIDASAVTAVQVNPWWQVDLGSSQTVSAIQITPVDNGNPLGNYMVFTSDQPISGTLSEILANTSIKKYSQPSNWAQNPQIIDLAGTARYVRIERTDTSAKSLAITEVKVMSKPSVADSGSGDSGSNTGSNSGGNDSGSTCPAPGSSDYSSLTKVDVTSYGAKANDGADDSSAIQKAINASGDNSVIYFPAGTYNISNRVTLKSNRVYSGSGATLKRQTGKDYIFKLDNASQSVTIDGLVLDGGGLDAGTALAKNLVVKNTTFKNITGGWPTGEGILLSAGAKDTTIVNNKFLNIMGETGVYGFNSFNNTNISNNYFDTVQEGIHLAYEGGGSGLYIRNNTFIRTHRMAVEIQGRTAQNIYVEGNVASEWVNPYDGSFFLSIVQMGYHIYVRNNHASSGKFGQIDSNANNVPVGMEISGRYVDVSGNVIENFREGNHLMNIRDAVVQNNTYWNQTWMAIWRTGISTGEFNAENITIKNNTIYNPRVTAFLFQGSSTGIIQNNTITLFGGGNEYQGDGYNNVNKAGNTINRSSGSPAGYSGPVPTQTCTS